MNIAIAVLKYNEKHDYYFFQMGRETFYNKARYMKTWETPEDAIIWFEEQFNFTPAIQELEGE